MSQLSGSLAGLLIRYLTNGFGMTSPQTYMIQRAEALFQRRTLPRRKLLDVLLSKTGHFSAEEVSKQMPAVGRATVYRTLAQLVDAGLVCRVLLEGGGLHYQVAPQRHHHHLVCIRCDKVLDVESCEVSEFTESIALRHGFAPLTHRLEIYGLCADCQKRETTAGLEESGH